MKQCPDCTLFSDDQASWCDCGYSFETGESSVTASDVESLPKDVRNGARWFYWVSGLSIVNSLLALFGSGYFFLIGLGVTTFVRAAIAGILGVPMPNTGFEPMLLPVVALEILVALSVAAVGRAASTGFRAAFVIGTIVYAVDAVFGLLAQGFASLAFHALALFFILKGYVALRKLHHRRIDASEGLPEPGRRWVQYVFSILPLAIYLPVIMISGFIMIAPVLFGVDSMESAVESMILDRAPVSFSDEEREQFSYAYSKVYERFDKEGRIAVEEAARMNRAIMEIVDRPAGQLATREELLELTRILESIGRVTHEDVGDEESAKAAQPAP